MSIEIYFTKWADLGTYKADHVVSVYFIHDGKVLQVVHDGGAVSFFPSEHVSRVEVQK